jgi:hypothetical protein
MRNQHPRRGRNHMMDAMTHETAQRKNVGWSSEMHRLSLGANRSRERPDMSSDASRLWSLRVVFHRRARAKTPHRTMAARYHRQSPGGRRAATPTRDRMLCHLRRNRRCHWPRRTPVAAALGKCHHDGSRHRERQFWCGLSAAVVLWRPREVRDPAIGGLGLSGYS